MRTTLRLFPFQKARNPSSLRAPSGGGRRRRCQAWRGEEGGGMAALQSGSPGGAHLRMGSINQSRWRCICAPVDLCECLPDAGVSSSTSSRAGYCLHARVSREGRGVGCGWGELPRACMGAWGAARGKSACNLIYAPERPHWWVAEASLGPRAPALGTAALCGPGERSQSSLPPQPRLQRKTSCG